MTNDINPERIRKYARIYFSGAIFANVLVFYIAWYFYFTSKTIKIKLPEFY